MRILIISNSEWDDNNSFGNTFNDFFVGLENVEIANIYCREGAPNTGTCNRFLKISDKELLKSILKRDHDPAKIVFSESKVEEKDQRNSHKLIDFIKQKRWASFFAVRELLWSVSNYKKQTFNRFIEDFSPDVIFLPTYSFAYINKMALYIQKTYSLPMVSYMSDDEYSLKRFKFSPIFWALRLYQSKWSVKGLKQSGLVYVISELQKRECKKELNIDCKILTKGADFSGLPQKKNEYGKPLQLVFTGNIGNNRYRTLADIASALKAINADGIKAFLSIYTATPVTDKMRRLLNIDGSSQIKGRVSSDEIKRIQKNADMLVHVEAFDLKNKLEVRQSFSTKLVDYFRASRPILAVGPKNIASIEHLIENDCAVCVVARNQIIPTLLECISDNRILNEKVNNAYICGKKYHNKSTIQEMLKKDLDESVKNTK